MPSPLVALVGAALLAAPSQAPVPEIPFETFKLPNGLNVILSQDRTAPIVGVDVHYDVGSKDEKPGRTGFAHLFEHLMFQGTLHLPKGEADRLIEAAGGSSNGATSNDQTVYWEQIPSNALEQMLFIQSERLGFLLPTLDQEKLDNQREVVKNERRQNYEMRPYGLVPKVIAENLWDPAFPYHWLTIGSHEDLSAATLEDVKEFFRRFYVPANASLAIAGDIDVKRTRALVERWFGDIPPGPKPARKTQEPQPLASEKRVRMEDDVELPRLYVAWQSPRVFAPGDAALDLAGAVLTDGKSARLVNRLVMKEQIANSVAAFQQSEALASEFMVVATPKPGTTLERVEKEIDEELERLAKEGPSPTELQRAKNKIESGMIFALEPVGGFGGRAAALNAYYLRTGDPGFFPKDLARYRAVTAEEVRDATARWLRKDARVVVSVVPRAGTPPARRAGDGGAAMPAGKGNE